MSSNLTHAVAPVLSNQAVSMRAAFLMVPLALLAAPVAAQGFEGTVTMNVPAAGGAINDMRYYVKGGQMAVVAKMAAASGPMAGMEVRMIMDMKARTMTMLIPLTGEMASAMGGMGGGTMKGFKQVTSLDQTMKDKGADAADVKALGTSQTIAGHKCDDYQITSKDAVTLMCLSNDMGAFAFASAGLGGRRGGATAPAWANFFAKNPGFPLKVWDKDGKVTLEVTKIEKGPVDPSLFQIPEGYTDPKGMFGGRGGGGV